MGRGNGHKSTEIYKNVQDCELGEYVQICGLEEYVQGAACCAPTVMRFVKFGVGGAFAHPNAQAYAVTKLSSEL